MGEYKVTNFLTTCHKFYGGFENFVNTGLYRAGHFKTPLLLQFCSNLRPIQALATIVEYRLFLFLAICQILKMLGHFEI